MQSATEPAAPLTAQEQALLLKLAQHVVSESRLKDFEDALADHERDLLWSLERRKLVQLGWAMTDAGREAYFAAVTGNGATVG